MKTFTDKNEIYELFGKGLPDLGEIGRITSPSQLNVCHARGLRRALLDLPTVLNDPRMPAAAEEKKLRPVIDTRLSVIKRLLLEREDQPRAKELVCSTQTAYFEREVYIVPENLVSVTAYATHDGVIDLSTAQDLRGLLNGSFLRFRPSRMNTVIVSVSTREIPDEPDRTSPVTFRNEEALLRGVFGETGSEREVLLDARDPYERRFLYAEDLGERFLDRYGYDIMRFLGVLFVKTEGAGNAYVIDYFRMMGQLMEEAYYAPKREWFRTRAIRSTIMASGEDPRYDQMIARLNKCEYIAKELPDLGLKNARDKIIEWMSEGYTPIVNLPLSASPEDAAAAEIERSARRMAFLCSLGEGVSRCYVLVPSDSVFCGEGEALASMERCNEALSALRIETAVIDAGEIRGLKEKEGTVIVVPYCPVLSEETLADLVGYLHAGGVVLLAEGEPYSGKDARAFRAALQELVGGKYAYTGRTGVLICRTGEELTEAVGRLIAPDVKTNGPVRALHRRCCGCDWFIVSGAVQHARLDLAAKGKAELWSVRDGSRTPFFARREKGGRTELIAPYTADGVYVFCFDPSEKAVTVATRGLCRVIRVDDDGGGVLASAAIPGKKEAYVYLPDRTKILKAEFQEAPEDLALNGKWSFHLGTGGESVVHIDTLKRADGTIVKVGRGTDMMRLSPQSADTSEIEHHIAETGWVDGEVFTDGDEQIGWEPFSLGEDGRIRLGAGRHYLAATVCAGIEEEVALCADVRPDRLYVNGSYYPVGRRIRFKAGLNRILMRFDGETDTALVFESGLRYADETGTAMARYAFWTQTEEPERFRFTLPPFAKKLRIRSYAEPAVFFGERECVVLGGRKNGKAGTEYAIRVESKMSGRELELRFEKQENRNGGALLAAPIEVICGGGERDVDEPGLTDALGEYRGNLHYAKSFALDVLDSRYELDLGAYRGTATVSVNGTPAGVMFGGERVDVTKLLRNGNNVLCLDTAYDGAVDRTVPDGTIRLRLSKVVTLE
ncbi:MAG: hypothetical protein KIG36_04590 [Eubacteriales bacterium]|nr:hypothetical protein [Eubacteriales bacterium]